MAAIPTPDLEVPYEAPMPSHNAPSQYRRAQQIGRIEWLPSSVRRRSG